MALLVRPCIICSTRSLLYGQTKRTLFHLSLPLQRPFGILDSSHLLHRCGPKIKWGYHHFLGRNQAPCMSTEAKGHINNQGSVDSPLMHSMENKIKEQLDAEFVSVQDAYGDGRHVSIHIVSSSFEGISAVNRQRMVYKAIWEELQETVHAVDQMITMTPAEAAREKSSH